MALLKQQEIYKQTQDIHITLVPTSRSSSFIFVQTWSMFFYLLVRFYVHNHHTDLIKEHLRSILAICHQPANTNVMAHSYWNDRERKVKQRKVQQP